MFSTSNPKNSDPKPRATKIDICLILSMTSRGVDSTEPVSERLRAPSYHSYVFVRDIWRRDKPPAFECFGEDVCNDGFIDDIAHLKAVVICGDVDYVVK